MDGDRNELSIPYHGTHIFIHVHILLNPFSPQANQYVNYMPKL